MNNEMSFRFRVGKVLRVLGMCASVVGLSHLLVGGCGGSSSSSSIPQPKATVTATAVQLAEGDTANLFVIALDKVSIKDLTISYTVGGTATTVDDHDLVDGSVVIAAGDLIATLTVTTVHDLVDEGLTPETIEITLVEGTGFALGDPSVASVNIIDIDVANVLPVSVADAYTVNENDSLVVAVADGVLDNDTDANFDVLTATLITDVSSGALTLNADGSFTYTPTADFFGADSFEYAADDGTGQGNTVTVEITVNQVNDIPVAVDNTYSTGLDVALIVPAAGILTNDSDPDNYPVSPLTANLVSSPANGTVDLAADGSFVYTPNAGFFGSDSFTYTAFDGENDSNVATVTIIVNSPPVANNDTYTGLNKKVTNIVVPGVLLNDTDADGDPLVVNTTVIDSPTLGTVTLNADGSFSYKYTNNADIGLPDSFTYTVNDGLVDSNVATVYINPVP